MASSPRACFSSSSFSLFYFLLLLFLLLLATPSSSSVFLPSSDPHQPSSLDVAEDRGLMLLDTPNAISYGSLTADSVRCPPMSGSSYYLRDCDTDTGPANPYRRSCSAITRCSKLVS